MYIFLLLTNSPPVNLNRASLIAQLVKNPPAMQETGVRSGLERPPGEGNEGNGSSLQYSCLENSLDRGAWRATVHAEL